MRVILVDDHALFREGLALLLGAVDADVQVTHAGTIAQALGRLKDEPLPDLVLLDMGLPLLGGVEGLRLVRAQAERVPVVVLSGADEPVLIHACIEAGAMGFIPKSINANALMAALRRVFDGEVYLPPLIESHLCNIDESTRAVDVLGLTPRQRDVLACWVKGMTNRTIAEVLNISELTVKSHMTVLMQVLGVSNRTEAVYAVRNLKMRAQ